MARHAHALTLMSLEGRNRGPCVAPGRLVTNTEMHKTMNGELPRNPEERDELDFEWQNKTYRAERLPCGVAATGYNEEMGGGWVRFEDGSSIGGAIAERWRMEHLGHF